MGTYASFLRGINVGGRTVRSEQLVEIAAGLGFEDPWTFLASGNMVFTADEASEADLEGRIEEALAAGLGYAVAAFVRTADHVRDLAAVEPFPDVEGGKLHVAFLKDEIEAETRAELLGLAGEKDRAELRGRELFWHVGGGFLESPLGDRSVERLLGDRWTVRTANTVRRIAAKLRG